MIVDVLDSLPNHRTLVDYQLRTYAEFEFSTLQGHGDDIGIDWKTKSEFEEQVNETDKS